MRVQHNIMAMSAYRNYTNNVAAMKKNLEKLSSGYKINRAGDDAAGLAISEKMRAQITGLQTAQKNAKDGISLVQTAEGALTEVHDMLNRMVELATQSANGTYESSTDRTQLQKEVEQLRSEINRIADSANFNGIQLLDGTMDGAAKAGTFASVDVTALADGNQDSKKTQKGEYTIDFSDLKATVASAGTATLEFMGTTIASVTLTTGDVSSTLTVGDFTFVTASITATIGTANVVFNVTVSEGKVTLKGDVDPTEAQASQVAGTALVAAVGTGTGAITINNGFDLAVHHVEELQFGADPTLAQGSFALTTGDIVDGASIKIGNQTYTFKVGKDGKGGSGTVIDLSAYEAGASDIAAAAAKALSQQANEKFDITAPGNDGVIKLTEKAGKVNYKTEWDLSTPAGQTGPKATWKNAAGESVVQLAPPKAGSGTSLTLQIGDTAQSFNQLKVDIADMHCSSLGIGDIDISSQAGAQAAIDKIKSAINQVSDVRGTLGATQNRLDHTINNLSVMTENIQDAESTIRDTDVAEEMMAYTKNNILIQSAQAMLAQANQVPQGVLQLLQ